MPNLSPESSETLYQVGAGIAALIAGVVVGVKALLKKKDERNKPEEDEDGKTEREREEVKRLARENAALVAQAAERKLIAHFDKQIQQVRIDFEEALSATRKSLYERNEDFDRDFHANNGRVDERLRKIEIGFAELNAYVKAAIGRG